MVGLDYIALIVSSEESLRFYEKLGFREKTYRRESYEKRYARYETSECIL